MAAFAPKCEEQTSRPSLDHLVGAGEQRRGHVEAERAGGVAVVSAVRDDH
jgi:hypothetical protein